MHFGSLTDSLRLAFYLTSLLGGLADSHKALLLGEYVDEEFVRGYFCSGSLPAWKCEGAVVVEHCFDEFWRV